MEEEDIGKEEFASRCIELEKKIIDIISDGYSAAEVGSVLSLLLVDTLIQYPNPLLAWQVTKESMTDRLIKYLH